VAATESTARGERQDRDASTANAAASAPLWRRREREIVDQEHSSSLESGVFINVGNSVSASLATQILNS
jgi:hypothetical protein